jgi:hypothetical protein
VEDPVSQLIDAGTNEILYTVRASGKTFTPRAPKDRAFIVKAGKDVPDTIVSSNATVGSEAQAVDLP